MAARKKGGKAPRKTATKAAQTKRAVRVGALQAKDVLALREKQRRRRSAALKRQPAQVARAMTRAAAVPPKTAALLGPRATMGLIIAEGDSWFDYPLHDVLEMLEDEHGYDVESVAHKGDRVEDMAYSGGQLEEFARRLEKSLRNGKVPKAILLSGGGNDMAGKEFEMLLNHAASPIAGFSDKVVTGVIDERARVSYVTIISAITAICQDYLGRPLPILTHGYDYPVPDGRGFLGGLSFLPGPWLEPGFRVKGFTDRAANTRMMKELINRFNEMVRTVAATPGFAHVRYVNLRNTLSSGSDYKRDWANELHPTKRGFRAVADRFAEAIASL